MNGMYNKKAVNTSMANGDGNDAKKHYSNTLDDRYHYTMNARCLTLTSSRPNSVSSSTLCPRQDQTKRSIC
jgi:hypothetical protein